MIMVIMSHGHDGVIYGRDGMPVSIEKTLQLFNNENCRSLQNKPKVIFMQNRAHLLCLQLMFVVEVSLSSIGKITLVLFGI